MLGGTANGRRAALGAICGVALALGTATAAQAECADADTPITAASAPAATAAVLCLLDEARAQYDVGRLTRNAALSTTAQEHADRIASGADPFAHDDSAGRTTDQRAKANGYPGFAGENLAGAGTPREAIELLLGDAPHRESLLDRGHSDVGAGVAAQGPGKPYPIISIVVGDNGPGAGVPTGDEATGRSGLYFSIGQIIRKGRSLSVSGSATGKVGRKVSVTLKRGRDVRRATGVADEWGIWSVTIRRPGGRGPMKLTATVRDGSRTVTKTRTLR